ncbi:MAG TPA: flagellar basal body-associated FliL family protein [Patescibacteria group bacterium]|nr:flagellar basal body-associated FliL family protein [Patescibacteria group bacterium]
MADAKKAKLADAGELKADPKKPGAPAAADGEPTPEGAEGEAPAPKFSKKKIAIFALIPLLIIAGGAGAAWKMGYLDKFLHKKIDCTNIQESDADYQACVEEMAKAGSAAPVGVFVSIPDMIVNLNSTGKQQRFLKIALKVELEDTTSEKAFEIVMPRVIDQFQAYLRELRIEDLRGSSGMYRMKIELLSRVRAAAPDIKVRDVLFQEFLLQ